MAQLFQTIFNPASHLAAKIQRGASAVEMALLLPLLIIMIDGVVEVSILLHNQSVLVSATNMAARSGMANTSPKLSNELLANQALDYCQSHLISVGASSAPVADVEQSIDPVFPQPIKVRVSYTYQGFLATSFLSAFKLDQPMTAITVMYNE